MKDTFTYEIDVRGQVDEAAFNASSPLRVRVIKVEADSEFPLDRTRLSVCCDQSGLIGLLRHLHGRGLVLLSVNCME
jgi:hypothetical protein